MRVLLRASGPALSGLGVAGALANPQLALFQGGDQKAYNDDWGGREELKAASAEAGAFAWRDRASTDAALIATLSPGAYTAVISGVEATSGVALAEVYELR
jgi:hypothetical protein